MSRSFQWNGVNIPFPVTGMQWGHQEVNGSDDGRTQNGDMDKTIIAVKRTLKCNYKSAPDSVASSLLTNIKSQVYGNLTYPDPETGGDTTKIFYTGNPTAEFLCFVGDVAYWDIEIDFVEK